MDEQISRTIVLVDDDRNILASLSFALEDEGFRVLTFADGESAFREISERLPSLAILDISMPRMDGIELLRRVRQKSSMPVIMLTSKHEEVDEILGFRMGADDYICKPFSQRLLIERIRALLRRVELINEESDDGEIADRTRVCGELRLDPVSHTCTWKGLSIRLTYTEFLILLGLAERPGRVLNRDQLMNAAYGEHIYLDDRTVDSHIKRLRRKFRLVDPIFSEIETLYGIGYRFRQQSKDASASPQESDNGSR